MYNDIQIVNTFWVYYECTYCKLVYFFPKLHAVYPERINTSYHDFIAFQKGLFNKKPNNYIFLYYKTIIFSQNTTSTSNCILYAQVF